MTIINWITDIILSTLLDKGLKLSHMKWNCIVHEKYNFIQLTKYLTLMGVNIINKTDMTQSVNMIPKIINLKLQNGECVGQSNW